MESREEVKGRAIKTYKKRIERIKEKNSTKDREVEIERFLEDSVNDWENSRKASRTTSTIFFLQKKIGRKIEDKELIRTLTSLDAQVNALDDLIDKNLGKEEKVKIAAQVAYAGIFTWSSVSVERKNLIQEILINYFDHLFQIPKIEEKKLAEMRKANKEDDLIQAAADSYRLRAEDITAFAKISASFLEIDENSLLDEIKNFRAREMISIDIQDIERDLEENDPTPVIFLLQNYQKDEAMRIIDRIKEKFQAELAPDFKKNIEKTDSIPNIGNF